MCMFLCMYRISISIFAKFQNLLTSGLYCLRKQREKRGWKKACQQVNCALGSHSENGEKIMRYKNNCVYNLVLTNLMLWGAGLWFLSPRKGTYSGFSVEKVCEVLAFISYRPEKVNSEAESINYLLRWCQFHALCSQPFYKNGFASWKLAQLFFRLSILILCVHFPFTTTIYKSLTWKYKIYTGVYFQWCHLYFWAEKYCFNYDANGHQQWSCSLEESPLHRKKKQHIKGRPGWSLSKMDFFHGFEDYA